MLTRMGTVDKQQPSLDRLDKQLWRLRWWPLIPLVAIATIATARWGTPGFLIALALAVVVATIFYFIRRPLNRERLQLLGEEAPDAEAGA